MTKCFEVLIWKRLHHPDGPGRRLMVAGPALLAISIVSNAERQCLCEFPTNDRKKQQK